MEHYLMVARVVIDNNIFHPSNLMALSENPVAAGLSQSNKETNKTSEPQSEMNWRVKL